MRISAIKLVLLLTFGLSAFPNPVLEAQEQVSKGTKVKEPKPKGNAVKSDKQHEKELLLQKKKEEKERKEAAKKALALRKQEEKERKKNKSDTKNKENKSLDKKKADEKDAKSSEKTAKANKGHDSKKNAKEQEKADKKKIAEEKKKLLQEQKKLAIEKAKAEKQAKADKKKAEEDKKKNKLKELKEKALLKEQQKQEKKEKKEAAKQEKEKRKREKIMEKMQREREKLQNKEKNKDKGKKDKQDKVKDEIKAKENKKDKKKKKTKDEEQGQAKVEAKQDNKDELLKPLARLSSSELPADQGDTVDRSFLDSFFRMADSANLDSLLRMTDSFRRSQRAAKILSMSLDKNGSGQLSDSAKNAVISLEDAQNTSKNNLDISDSLNSGVKENMVEAGQELKDIAKSGEDSSELSMAEVTKPMPVNHGSGSIGSDSDLGTTVSGSISDLGSAKSFIESKPFAEDGIDDNGSEKSSSKSESTLKNPKNLDKKSVSAKSKPKKGSKLAKTIGKKDKRLGKKVGKNSVTKENDSEESEKHSKTREEVLASINAKKEKSREKYRAVIKANSSIYYSDATSLLTFEGQVALANLSKFLEDNPGTKLMVELTAVKDYKKVLTKEVISDRINILRTAILSSAIGFLERDRVIVFAKVNQNIPFNHTGVRVRFSIIYE